MQKYLATIGRKGAQDCAVNYGKPLVRSWASKGLTARHMQTSLNRFLAGSAGELEPTEINRSKRAMAATA